MILQNVRFPILMLRGALIATALFSLAACNSVQTHNEAHNYRPETQESFEVASTVGEDTLSDMRGGFNTGGLNIDFGLSVSTQVLNSGIESNFTINGGSSGIQSVQQVFQNGNKNSYTPSSLSKYVAVELQNTQNNAKIQNYNTLNLVVSHLANIRVENVFLNSINSSVRAQH